jgi:hypothetical protein
MPVDDFYKDPKSFLDTNVVRVGSVPLKDGETTGSVFHLELAEKAGASVTDATGKTIGKVYDLRRGDASSPGIDAFFCPYKQNSTHFITLSNAAQYVFTTQMDGCTFGIGNDTKGALIVGHANYGSLGAEWEHGYSMSLNPDQENNAPLNTAMGRQRQRQAQMATLNSKMGWAGRFIKPEDYMPNDVGRATTFGVRETDGWKFYTARYWTADSWTFQHRGVVTQFKGI